MNGELARREPRPPQHHTNVSGEVTLTGGELAIRLRPTVVSEAVEPEREPRTVIARPIPRPVVVRPPVYSPARWVFDRQSVTALLMFALVTALVIVVWLVIP